MQIQIDIFMATFTGGVEKLSGATVNAVTSITDGGLTQYGGVTAGAAGILTGTAAMTDGQILIGDSTPGQPIPATISAGTGITVTNGHHSITIAATAGNIQTVTFNLTSANILAMYATPVQVIAGVAANVIVPLSVSANFIYNSTQYTGGSDVGLQYGNTAHNAGQGMMNGPVLFATDLQGTANTMAVSGTAFGSNAHFASSVGIAAGIFISNSGSAFITGNSTATLTITYITVPMS